MIGVDVGEAALATVCHRDEHGTPTNAEVYSDAGAKVRQLRETYYTATRRLQNRDAQRLIEEYGDALWRRIDDIIHSVSPSIIEYAEHFSNPVLVIENLDYIREELDYSAFLNRRLHGWAFRKLQDQLRYKAAETGIRVESVPAAYTSTTCHACGEEGYRPHQGTFKCTNEACWVKEYQADVNGALNIADRYQDPAGESHGRDSEKKASGDDSGGGGASLTGPQDTAADGRASNQSESAGLVQTTLATYAS